ncbi:MAG: redoxin domain-containing protein [bacterium]|nr:redoxin domain-containing protein [bacterium]
MNWLLTLLIPMLLGLNTSTTEPKADSLDIYFFVAETCPICQYYTAKINQIANDNPTHNVILIFPNSLSSEETMAKFKKKYKLDVEMRLDTDHELVQKFGATVTPEVVVHDPKSDSVLYQGRIDDNYARVGQRKRQIQSDDLVDALNAIQNETPIATAKTSPVGCYISQKSKK